MDGAFASLKSNASTQDSVQVVTTAEDIQYPINMGATPSGVEDPGMIIRPHWVRHNPFGLPVWHSKLTECCPWVSPHDHFVPPHTIVGGHEMDVKEKLYVARVRYKDGIHPGKASLHYGKVYISFDGKEISFSPDAEGVEVLVGSASSVDWALISGSFSLDKLPAGLTPIPGGHEADKAPLYVAQAAIHDGVHCGKVKINDIAHIPYGGKEDTVKEYNVLGVYAPDTRR